MILERGSQLKILCILKLTDFNDAHPCVKYLLSSIIIISMLCLLVLILQAYAGKYIPALAYKIHQANPSADLKINLKGVVIGEGLCDPVNVRVYIMS